MRITTLCNSLLLASLLLCNACRENTGAADFITVNNTGDITLFGQKTTLENLKTALLDSLVNMAKLPQTIGIKYGDQVLMGMRSEVETEVNAALAEARKAHMRPIVGHKFFVREKGSDCDQPDTLRSDCGRIELDYPVVYFKEAPLGKAVQAWATGYLAGMLTVGAEESGNSPSLDAAAKTFFDAREDFQGSVMYGVFVADCTFEVLFNNGYYLTLEITGFSFQGGAHGNPTAAVATFDVRTGKQLQWADLVTDQVALQALAEKKFRQERAEIFNDGFDFDSSFPFALPANYGLTPKGIYFHFLHYEVGPYAIGNTTFVLPFGELGALLKPLNINADAN